MASARVTDSGTKACQLPAAGRASAASNEDVLRQVAETLEKEGNARAMFIEPVKLDRKSIIPVACVPFGSGGGVGFSVNPVGFVHEEDGAVVFTRNHLDVKNEPFLTEAAQELGRAIDTVTTVVTRRRLARVPAPHPSA